MVDTRPEAARGGWNMSASTPPCPCPECVFFACVLELVKSVKSPISNGRCIVASICFTVQRSRREGSECRGEEDWDKSDWMYARTPDVVGLPRAAKALRVICVRTSLGNATSQSVNIPSSARTLRSRICSPMAIPGRGWGCDWVENMPNGILANENGESTGMAMMLWEAMLKDEALRDKA